MPPLPTSCPTRPRRRRRHRTGRPGRRAAGRGLSAPTVSWEAAVARFTLNDFTSGMSWISPRADLKGFVADSTLPYGYIVPILGARVTLSDFTTASPGVQPGAADASGRGTRGGAHSLGSSRTPTAISCRVQPREGAAVHA